jgi:hypothetical protein
VRQQPGREQANVFRVFQGKKFHREFQSSP